MKKLLIGLLALGSISSFAKTEIIVEKCSYKLKSYKVAGNAKVWKHDYTCKDKTLNRLGKRIIKGLNLRFESTDKNQTLRLEVFRGNQAQNGIVTKSIKADLIDSSGDILKTSYISKGMKRFISMDEVVEELRQELSTWDM